MQVYQQIKKDIPENDQINFYLLVMGARPAVLIMSRDVTYKCSLLDRFFRVYNYHFGTFYMNDWAYAYYLDKDGNINSKEVGVILGYPFPYHDLNQSLDSFKLRDMASQTNFLGFRIARDTDTKFMREWALPLTKVLQQIDIYCEIVISSYMDVEITQPT